jgi:hypothetical protein
METSLFFVLCGQISVFLRFEMSEDQKFIGFELTVEFDKYY